MQHFRYLAYNAAGGRVSDSMPAMSPDEVKRKLWSEGLYVVKIERSRWKLPTLEEAFPTFVRVRRSEVILFTKQLATFVRVGIPEPPVVQAIVVNEVVFQQVPYWVRRRLNGEPPDPTDHQRFYADLVRALGGAVHRRVEQVSEQHELDSQRFGGLKAPRY